MARKIEGLIAYFGLQDWWLTEFSETERERIEQDGFGKPTLTHGTIKATSHTAHSVIVAMAGFWRPTPEEERLILRLMAKANEIQPMNLKETE
ncbi:hypothetical protein [Methylomonas rapida]|uniref:Uncharacterized protein n=1 Tax=Methylomonas rapida TaxID=2963939 RepID=A0ABY7GLW1_9GAMM|nr:hypothetical protein [Methylomonas rapida]WAR45492.1 hypothetical protein NM686_002970 [Methylomonas rapida]